MAFIKAFFLAQYYRVRNWWSNNQQHIGTEAKNLGRRLIRGFDRVIRNISLLILTGLIFNLVNPDFSQKFPTIFGWFNGWAEFGEFAIKAALKGLYATFTGGWKEFWPEYTQAVDEIFQSFVDWVRSLSF